VAVGQHWGHHMGVLPAGRMCCVCYPTNVAYIVAKNTIRYDARIMECPTKDNVRVNVDIYLMLRIMEDEASIKKFIYKMGASRLDDILQTELEEAVRNFIRTLKHTEVFDLKSEMATKMIAELNQKFNTFGVLFENASISSIQLPKGFEYILSETTKYDIKLQNQIKKSQNDLIMACNEQNKLLLEQKKESRNKLLENKGAKERALLEREEKIVKTQTTYDLDVLNTEKKASLAKIKLENEKIIATYVAEKNVQAILSDAQSFSNSHKIAIDGKLKSTELQQNTNLECIKNKSEGIVEQAAAEQNVGSYLKLKRDHDYIIAQLESYKGKVFSRICY
jgi:regulator of protease activity HflC (stomatin/prohibitin superfamily)